MRAFNDTAILVILCAMLGVICGCAVVGPTSISMGRADYNEAINWIDVVKIKRKTESIEVP